ncbi:hypothetical protein [Halogranum rubrum]|uniref:Glycosyltransferase RgtA/B/C/D-like domain-containing protein n=1 Tax=Halogranum salarium B-1 TaxID=1210908 RepID=J2ZBG3_9EURY|nr:hypothetical protein [Halogranum salarium]EJN58000.1 hypothetical protein HSB1_34170 [Halogranum salarium B-1]
MSDRTTRLRSWLSTLGGNGRLVSEARDVTLTSVVFGDRYGLTLFVGALVFFGLTWRVGFFINDNYTVANALVNLADGHFAVTDIVYGPASGDTPGMVTANGQRFGRNYGQVVFSLPVYYLLELVAAVADFRLALVGAWCLSVLAFCLLVGRLVGREREFGSVGAVLALVCFLGNLAVATELSAHWTGLLALQLTSMAAAALTGVFVYRLLAAVADPRTGLVAGVVTVLATPLGFWAAIPKRHTYVAFFVVATLYVFYLSRTAPTDRRATRLRATTYALVGIATWVQPAESLILFVALVAVDVPTAPSNHPRDLAVVGGVFFVSLLPFFLTNVALSGNPLQPPRTLTPYDGSVLVESAGGPQSDGPIPADPVGDSVRNEPVSALDSAVALLAALSLRIGATLFEQVGRFVQFLTAGVAAFGDPDRLYHVFVRGGYLPGIARKDGGTAINLSLVESAPVFGALVALPRLLGVYVRRPRPFRDAVGATDLLAGVVSVLFVVVYLPRLPLHAMVTLRYLVPMMPLLVYAVFRLRAIRDLLRHTQALSLSFVATVLFGTQLLFAVLFVQRATLGEAVQAHALVNLVAAGCLAGWVVVEWGSSTRSERFTTLGAVTLGVVCGVTTSFLLLSGGVYFAESGDFLLPLVRWVSESVQWL